VEQKVLLEMLSQARSRGQVKSLGRMLDTEPEVRMTAESLAQARGIDEFEFMDGKRLVKCLLDRTSVAQVRTNPIHRDEAFPCIHCGHAELPGGAMVRDHCSRCLHGLHVDVVPGDRAAECSGLLVPVDFSVEGRAGVVIHYRCARCGYVHRTRAHTDDSLPVGLQLGEEAP
jgi:hypothetical protein